MSNIVEETSKVAQQTISALNSVPVLLALVLLQFFILGAVLFLSIQRDKNVHQRFLLMIERCVGVSDKRAEIPSQFLISRPPNDPPHD